MSQLPLFGDPTQFSEEELKFIGLPKGRDVAEWAFINADGRREQILKVASGEVLIPADQELADRIVAVLEDRTKKDIDYKEQRVEAEAIGEPAPKAETDILSVDVPLVSQSETAGQHWTLGGGVDGVFGTRRQAVNSFGLDGDPDAGDDIGVVVVDVGVSREYLKRIGRPESYGGGWRRAVSPQPNGLYEPGDYQNPTGRLSDGHGNMIARNVLSLAPKATIYDAAILPDRVLNFTAFSRHARAILRGVQRVILNPNDNPIFPKHKHWIIVNAWAVATSFADAERPFSYADNRAHRLNAKLIELADLPNVEVVFAAGNSGAFQPARFAGPYDRGHARSIWGANGLPEVHTIGAVRTDGLSIGASSQGPSRPELLDGAMAGAVNQKPDFCAPSWFCEDDDRSITNTGTSAACGIFAGYLAATIKESGISNSSVLKDQLKMAASRSDEWNSQRGYGTVDASALPAV